MSIHASARAALVVILFGHAARAAVCEGPLGRGAVVACALGASLDVQHARQELKVIAGRRVSAGLWLPTNPLVSATISSRRPPLQDGFRGASVIDWSATLEQQIEIGGQRGARLAEVDAEAAAQIRRVSVAEREATAAALQAYYDVLSAEAELNIADQLSSAATALSLFAEERVRASLMSPVDADLIMAEGVRVRLVRVDAEQRRAVAAARLASLLGREMGSPIVLEGTLELDPLDGASTPDTLTRRALLLRGEVAAYEAERLAVQQQLSGWRRSRAPNLTLSVFAQRDGFDERVLGAGLSLPLPLPAPVGHTFAGQIAETSARLEQAAISVEQIRRRVREEVAIALATEKSRTKRLALYDPELVARARADIDALRDGISSRQLSVRDALVAERTLMELLLGQMEARLALVLARIEVMRATGQSFFEVTP